MIWACMHAAHACCMAELDFHPSVDQVELVMDILERFLAHEYDGLSPVRASRPHQCCAALFCSTRLLKVHIGSKGAITAMARACQAHCACRPAQAGVSR
jgi:hypothetical protein